MTMTVVRGTLTAEEMAAVLVVLRASRTDDAPIDRYTQWRRTRLDALRHKGMSPG